MKISFKQFNQIMNLPEITEEKLDEIFGIFKNNDKIAQAKKKREELTKKLGAQQYALRLKQQNQKMAAANKAANTPSPARKDPRSASGAKAAEMDWIKSMQSEGLTLESEWVSTEMNDTPAFQTKRPTKKGVYLHIVKSAKPNKFEIWQDKEKDVLSSFDTVDAKELKDRLAAHGVTAPTGFFTEAKKELVKKKNGLSEQVLIEMRDDEIEKRCVEKLGMSKEDAKWVVKNLDNYFVPDWSEWSWRKIDQTLRDTLSFKKKKK